MKQTPAFAKTPESYWLSSTPKTDYPFLEGDIEVDVAIIGGGLAGISTAYFLKREGVKVAVVEADRICQGTTGHSTAKITAQHSLIYNYIQTQFGKEFAQQYADANQEAIKVMASLIEEHNIDCDFQWKSAYVYTQQDKYIEKIRQEAETASGLGIKSTFTDNLDFPLPVKAALCFEEQAQFHPRKYVLALAEMIPGDGSHIFEHTRALTIEEGNPSTVITKGGNLRAKTVVLASHFPFHDGLGLYFARMYAERSYVLGVLTQDKLPEGMFVTAETPGQSFRTQGYKDGEMILVAGEQHKTARGADTITHYNMLRELAANTFRVKEIPYRWSTQDYTTVDKIPYIGYVQSGKSNILVATGFRKWGISTSTVSGLLLTDLIVKGSSPWQDVYSPQRGISLRSAGQLVKFNLDVAKELISGKLQKPEKETVKNGEGKIIIHDGQKMGAYRDDQGQLHVVDITCTHLGCELKWNSGDKTWDCPCHGSRFTYEGEIVEGPALHPLQHVSGKNNIDPDIV